MFASALQKKESELRMAMVAPEVFHSRKHPSIDNSPRPPPKSFTDFEKDRNPSSMQNQPPKPPQPVTIRDQEDHDDRGIRQRIVYLEERTTTLENMVEDLTEAITNPKEASQTTTAGLIAHLVRYAVIDRVLPPEVALDAIAKELGIVDKSARFVPSVPMMVAPPPMPPPPPRSSAVQVTQWEGMPTREPAKPREKKPRERAPYRSWAKAPERGPDEPPPGIVEVTKNTGGQKAIVDAWPERAKVAEKMTEHGITQTALAKAAGIDQSRLSRYQRGGGCPADMAKRINAALDKLLK